MITKQIIGTGQTQFLQTCNYTYDNFASLEKWFKSISNNLWLEIETNP